MWQSSFEIWISGFQLKDKKKREIVDRHVLDRLGLAMTIFIDVTPCARYPRPGSRCEAAGLLRHENSPSPQSSPLKGEEDQGKGFHRFLAMTKSTKQTKRTSIFPGPETRYPDPAANQLVCLVAEYPSHQPSPSRGEGVHLNTLVTGHRSPVTAARRRTEA